MAWDILDDWFGINPDPPAPDQGAWLNKLSQDDQAAAAAAAKAKADQDAKDALAKARADAIAAANTRAGKYFTTRGLDPTQYQSDIDAEIASILSGISPDDPNPGGYLSSVDIGANVYTGAQDAARAKAAGGLSPYGSNYAYSKIGAATDDPFLADISAAERTEADSYLQNLLKRGVINQTGYQGGVANLGEQDARVRSQLDLIGGDILSSGRSSIQSIIDRANKAASTLTLGQQFDPATYQTEIDTAYADFMKTLPDRIKAATPTDLYDTSILSAVAGASQGAQNFAFDPNAVAGVIGAGDEDEEDPLLKKPISAGVF